MISKEERRMIAVGVVETIHALRDGLHSEDDHGYDLYKWLEENQEKIVDAACTASGYARAGKKGTQFMTVAQVALGKVKDYSKITYGLSEPPSGYDSCHGVRGTQFADDEFVIYKQNQQKMEYLVEFTSR